MHTVQTLQKDISEARARKSWDMLYTLLLLAAFGACLLLGVIPQYQSYLSLILFLCAAASFFSKEYFYLYTALFLFVRNSTVISTIHSYDLYVVLLLVRLLLDCGEIKIRVVYLPSICIMLLHLLLAATEVKMVESIKMMVYLVATYGVMSRILADDKLMRKFWVVFLMGMVVSGVYGYVAEDTVKEINTMGGKEEVARNVGILFDVNFAAIYYGISVFVALFIKGVPKLLKVALAGFALLMLLETVSLSGIITFAVMSVVALILKFRWKSVLILLPAAAMVLVLLSIPRVQQIKVVADLLARVRERLYYIEVGRWDMLTTGRTDLWETSLAIFNSKGILGKLFGGSVIITGITDKLIHAELVAVHQSVVQSFLNYGIIGTLVIYLSFLGVYFYRTLRHLLREPGYENEDIKIIQLLITGTMFCMSMTVDVFVQWTSLMLLLL